MHHAPSAISESCATASAKPTPIRRTRYACCRQNDSSTSTAFARPQNHCPPEEIGGSAVTGKIRVVDRGTEAATILVSIVNFPTNAYRIAIHERPNCSSPNGFSAGHAWAPPSSTKPPQDFVPIQYASAESRIEHELRIAGLRATGANGVAGRSVLVYAGNTVTEPRPDVPNDAVACGVFEPVRPLF